MENPEIFNHADLMIRIAQLREKKVEQEEDLKLTFREFANTLNPVMIVKQSLHELATDTDVKVDVVKVGLNLGTSFLIDMVFGRNRSVKGFISSVILEKISTSLINNNVSKIISGVSSLLDKNPKAKSNHTENEPV
ncbi:MAG: hypothetical protein IPP77_09725 [Bacteroidetes bacterium]|nr:hypothetical protein [Bacteroidota bacterium]